MFVLTHPDHGEVTVQTESAYMRHLEAGWKLKEPQEKEQQQPKRTRKPKE